MDMPTGASSEMDTNAQIQYLREQVDTPPGAATTWRARMSIPCRTA